MSKISTSSESVQMSLSQVSKLHFYINSLLTLACKIAHLNDLTCLRSTTSSGLDAQSRVPCHFQVVFVFCSVIFLRVHNFLILYLSLDLEIQGLKSPLPCPP